MFERVLAQLAGIWDRLAGPTLAAPDLACRPPEENASDSAEGRDSCQTDSPGPLANGHAPNALATNRFGPQCERTRPGALVARDNRAPAKRRSLMAVAPVLG